MKRERISTYRYRQKAHTSNRWIPKYHGETLTQNSVTGISIRRAIFISGKYTIGEYVN